MGCDIHVAVERLDFSGRWQLLPPPVEFIGPLWRNLTECDETPDELRMRSWFDLRNYELFRQIARAAKNDASAPVMKCLRGLPADASREIIENAETFEFGQVMHPTWLRLFEATRVVDEQWDNFLVEVLRLADCCTSKLRLVIWWDQTPLAFA
jgi:hypothetical protein